MATNGCVKAKIWHNEAEWREKGIQITMFPKRKKKKKLKALF